MEGSLWRELRIVDDKKFEGMRWGDGGETSWLALNAMDRSNLKQRLTSDAKESLKRK